MLQKNKITVLVSYILKGLFISPFLFLSAATFLPPVNFLEAKKILFPLYLENHPYTFYCGCRFDSNGIVVECPPDAQEFVGERIEWEHIVPASLLGRELSCWSQDLCELDSQARKGRECCQKTSEIFQWREAHLLNLVPVVKTLNRARSNYRPGWVFYKRRAEHLCGLWIDKKSRRIEPDEHLKGFMARTYLLMHQLYDFPLSHQDKLLFEQWDRQYPPDLWEKDRAQLLNQYYRVDNNR